MRLALGLKGEAETGKEGAAAAIKLRSFVAIETSEVSNALEVSCLPQLRKC